MTERKRDDESVSIEDQIARIEDERSSFRAEQEAVVLELRRLRAAEDPATGTYYAKEIFRLSQEKLRLEAEIDLRRRKINRLKMSDELHGIIQ